MTVAHSSVRRRSGMTADDADWEGLRAEGRGARFAALLRRHRRLAGLSQEALAERAGVSVRAVSGMERAEGHVPYAGTVRLLADALELSPIEREMFIATARYAPAPSAADAPDARFGELRALAPRALRLSARLPIPLSPLIGRADELAAAAALLREPATRLLTVTGAPGVGKTSFARRLVAGLGSGAFPDGMASIDLAPLTDAALVLPTLVETLAVGGPAQWTPFERLTAAFNGRRALLLLDTFERLVGAGSALLALLEACDGLTALVTSRTPLRLPGEREFPLAPLTLPAAPASPTAHNSASGARPPDPATLAALRETPAIALYLQRARAAQAAFRLTGANAAAIVALCRRLDGAPLAIELAAARVALQSPAATLAQLNQPLASPTASAHDLPSQPDWLGALRAALTWSYDLLTPAERWALRRLAVFVGGATIEAATAICTGAPTDSDAVTSSATSVAPLDLILSLTRQSLLVVERSDGDEESVEGARVRLLDTVRAYAAEQLRASGDAPTAQAAHARYYVALAEDVARRYRRGEVVDWESLAMELANLRAALQWATHHASDSASQDDADAATLGLRLATALGPLWYMIGLTQEGLRWIDELLAVGDAAHTGSARDRPLHEGSLTSLRRTSRALFMAGWLALDQGMRNRAIESLSASVGLARMVYAADSAHVNARTSLPTSAPSLAPDAPAALPNAATPVLDEQAQDDASLLGDALNRLGDALWRQGHYESAEAVFEESLELRRRVGDDLAVLYSLNNLAAVATARGHLETAWRLLGACLAQSRVMGNPYGEIGALCERAYVAMRQGRAEQAAALLDEALVVAQVRGADDSLAYILGRQGELARRQRDFALAEARWQASRAASPTEATNASYKRAQAWLGLGDVARDAGDIAEAMTRYAECLRICREVTVVDGAVVCMERIAALASDQGRHAEAIRLYGLADATRVRLGFPLEPGEQSVREAALTRARVALGAERFALAWDTGAATPWERGAALAQAAADAPTLVVTDADGART